VGSNIQFAPSEKSEYQLVSFLGDEEKNIYTVRDKRNVLTYLTANCVFMGSIDISQQANSIDMEIYREGDPQAKIYKVNQNKFMALNEGDKETEQQLYLSELTKSILYPPSVYLFQG
jgi:hypothetical protein